MTTDERRTAARLPLGLILLLGLALRLAPLTWGLPVDDADRGYHPDEPKVVRSIVEFPGIYLSTRPFRGYGTTLQYALGTVLLPVKPVAVRVADWDAYVRLAWIAARLGGVLAGVVSMLLLHRLARRLYDDRTALLAAGLLAVSLFHVVNSPLATMDVAMGLLILVCFLASFRAHDRPAAGSYARLGVALGLLVGTKTTGALFFVVPVGLALLAPAGRGRRLALCLLSLGVAGAVFAVTNPHVFVGFGETVEFYRRERADWMERKRGGVGELLGAWWRATSRSVGAPVAVAALAGALVPGGRHLRERLLLVVFVALQYAFWRWFLLGRYVVVVAPILCLFAAHALVLLIGARTRLVRLAGVAIAVACLAEAAYRCGWGIHARLHDTRTVAARFIDDAFPAGITVGLSTVSETYPWRTHAWQFPAVDWDRFEERDLLDGPEVLVLSSYDVTQVQRALRRHDLRPHYVLPETHHREWYRSAPPSPRLFRFYDELLNLGTAPYEPVRVFTPTRRARIEHPPPEIRVYRRTGGG
ncbi:MAG: ArnT family glycosyltransferase [Planctomycetota bacterium]